MGIRNKSPAPVEREEKAYIKDHLGLWEVDLAQAFEVYRAGDGYLYHGPTVMMGEVAHVFYTTVITE